MVLSMLMVVFVLIQVCGVASMTIERRSMVKMVRTRRGGRGGKLFYTFLSLSLSGQGACTVRKDIGSNDQQ